MQEELSVIHSSPTGAGDDDSLCKLELPQLGSRGIRALVSLEAIGAEVAAATGAEWSLSLRLRLRLRLCPSLSLCRSFSLCLCLCLSLSLSLSLSPLDSGQGPGLVDAALREAARQRPNGWNQHRLHQVSLSLSLSLSRARAL